MTIFLETSRRELTDITSLVQIGTSKVLNKDDTLDTFSFTIVIGNKKPFQMGACVRVFKADNVEKPWTASNGTDFAIVSDSVTYLGENAKAYEHTIQCVQYARKLCFQTIRGLELSQPKMGSQRDAVFSARYDYNSGSTYSYWTRGMNVFARPLNLVGTTSNEKVQAGGIVKLNCYMVSYDGSTYTLDENTSSIVYDLAPALCLYKKNSSGVWQYVSDILYLTDLTKHNTTHTITQSEAETINNALSSYGDGYGVGVRFDKMSKSVDLSTKNRHFFVILRMSCNTYRYTYRNVLEQIARKAYVHTANFDFGRLPYSVASDTALDVPAPDFQFSQNKTVYECVNEVAKVLGCKPVLTLNTGDLPTLSFQRMNDIPYMVEVGDGTVIAREENDSDGRKANRVVTSFQNGRPNAYVAEPSEWEIAGDSGNNYPFLFNHPRNKNLGIAQKTDWWFMTDMPINEVKRCVVPLYYNSMIQMYVSNNDFSSYSYQAVYTRINTLLVDVTDFVFDQTTYGALEQKKMESGLGLYQAYQQNSCYYSKGSKGIYVGSVNIDYLNSENYTFTNIVRSALCRMFCCDGVGMVDKSGSSISEKQPLKWLMYIEYYPQAQGCVSVEGASDTDYAYEKYMSMNIANASGVVALDKLGNSIYSTANMMGESSIGLSFNASSGLEALQRNCYMVDDGKLLVPSSLKETMVGDGIYKIDGLMSKNYSKISDRVQLDRSIRLTEISTSLALRSEIILPQYLYIACRDTLFGSDYDTYRQGLYNNLAMRRLMGGFDKTTLAFSNACMCIKPSTQDYGIIVPLSVYSCGNALCFEGNFDHAKSGGYQTTIEGANNIFTRPVYYTGDSGYLESFGVKLAMGAMEQYDTYPKVPDYSSFGVYKSTLLTYDSNIINSGYIYAYKQPNEIMGLNLEVVALPFEKEGEPSVIPTSKFWEINPLINGKKATTFKLYGSYSPYTPFDTRSGTLMSEITMSIAYDGLKAAATLSGTLQRGAIANWKLCDSEGNALLICNQYTLNGIETETLPTLYFSLFKERI